MKLNVIDETTGDSCSGGPKTDSEGRFLIRGLAPGHAYVLQAIDPALGVVKGACEPFQGQPGEVLPGIVIVCEDKGGIEGRAVDPEGQPVTNIRLHCVGSSPVGGALEGGGCVTDLTGRFTFLWAFPAGTYTECVFSANGRGFSEEGRIPKLAVTANEVVDVGDVVLYPLQGSAQ